MTSRAHDFALYRPNWWRDPSGLWVPPDLPLMPAMPASDPLPEELSPQPAPVAVAEGPPTDADAVIVYADEGAVGLPISSRVELEAMATAVPFAPALLGVARLAAVTYALPLERDTQLRLAEQIFGKGPILDRLQSFTGSEKPRGLVFAEQNMLVLLRLLIDHAKPSAMEASLTNDEAAILSRALFASTAITGELSRAATQSRPRLVDWLAFFTQNGAYNSRAQQMGALARAQELFGAIAEQTNIADWSNACPIEEWMVEDYGLTIDEQFTLGFALGAMTNSFDEDEAVGTQIYIAPENLHDLFVKLDWEDRETEVLATIAAPRETYQREFAESGDSLEHLAWDVLPFMRHPFLILADGGLLLLSPRALLSWLTDGFHYRLLDAAQRRSAGDRRRKISRKYTAFAGELLEKYALDLVRSVHPGERPVGGGRVYGEQPYGRVNSKGSAAEHTSDIAIDLGLDLVLIEVSVSRVRAETLLLGDTHAVTEDLDRMLVKKIRQLDHCIHALITGRAKIPAGGSKLEINRVERIWPVLVTAGNITQNAALWQYIRSQISRELTQSAVQPLTILDVEDLETICGLIEAGYALPAILAGKTKQSYAELELRYWLKYDPTAPREYRRPAYVAAIWDRATDRALAMMDMTKGVQTTSDQRQ